MKSKKLDQKCEALKSYFREHYSYIDFEMTDSELRVWVFYRPELPVMQLADLLSDYLLANGAYAQE